MLRRATIYEAETAANHAAVLPFSAPGCKHVDLQPFYNNPVNKAFGDARGVILLSLLSSQYVWWEWHWVLTPAIRGADALKFGREVLTEMFTRHGARAIRGPCPATNRAARLMNRALGARPVRVIGQDIIYRLEREEWAASLAVLSAALAD